MSDESCSDRLPRAVRLAVAAALAAVALLPARALAEIDVPPVPEDEHYILDRADLIGPDAADEIGEMQRRAAEKYETQIVVVTIHSTAGYGGAGVSIEEFARQWFDSWGIGIRRGEKLYNRGILLLVSRGDRKARIELGAEWGHRWDAYCRRVMNDLIVPQFKEGDYQLGITRGVDALVSMAERGPSADPPEPSVVDEIIRDAERWNEKLSMFSGPVQIFMIILGVLLIVLSYFIGDEKSARWMFWGGIGLIVVAVVTWVAVVALSAFNDSESTGYSGSAGGGGGFGGGFSGGGGATGSW